MPLTTARTRLGAAIGGAVLALGAHAQEPTNAPSATLPGPGLLSWRPMVLYDRFGEGPGGDPGEVERTAFMHHLVYGVAPEWAGFAEVGLVHRESETPAGDDDSTGLGDSRLGARWRFARRDFGPLSTFRAVAEASVVLPTATGSLADDTFTPALGLFTTTILGRHGINTSARYEFTTGEKERVIDPGDGLADHLFLGGAYLYRLAPSSYAEGGTVAVYSQFELLGHAETNGDASLDTGLGLLVEAPRWAAECSVILPVAEDLEERPERDFGLVVGVRFLF